MRKTTINEIMKHFIDEPIYIGYCKSFKNKNIVYSQELFSEFLMAMVQQKESKLIELYNNKQLIYYSISVIKNLVYNKYSKFNKTITENRDAEIMQEDISYYDIPIEEADKDLHHKKERTENKMDNMLSDIFEKLDENEENVDGFWYDYRLWQMKFVQGKAYRQIAEETKIPASSVFHSVKKVIDLIDDDFYEQYKGIDL